MLKEICFIRLQIKSLPKIKIKKTYQYILYNKFIGSKYTISDICVEGVLIKNNLIRFIPTHTVDEIYSVYTVLIYETK